MSHGCFIFFNQLYIYSRFISKKALEVKSYSSQKRYDMSSFQSSKTKSMDFYHFQIDVWVRIRSLTSIESKLSDYLVVTRGTRRAVSAYKLVTMSIGLFHHFVVPHWRHVWSEPQLPYIQRWTMKKPQSHRCSQSEDIQRSGGQGEQSQIAKFMGSTWGAPGSCQSQMGPMLAPWTLLSGVLPQGTNNF